jgi:molybdate transport system ATP-binding protein/molybdate transport system permease protein
MEFAEEGEDLGRENTFPCWLVQSSETPFRITLFLSLQRPSSPPHAEGTQLQAEVFKEKWLRFRDKPFPWHVRLLADAVFWMKE